MATIMPRRAPVPPGWVQRAAGDRTLRNWISLLRTILSSFDAYALWMIFVVIYSCFIQYLSLKSQALQAEPRVVRHQIFSSHERAVNRPTLSQPGTQADLNLGGAESAADIPFYRHEASLDVSPAFPV